MDLSFARRQFDKSTPHVAVLPVALAVLLVGVAGRQAASPTARAQAALPTANIDGLRFAPAGGAFHAATAAALMDWKEA